MKSFFFFLSFLRPEPPDGAAVDWPLWPNIKSWHTDTHTRRIQSVCVVIMMTLMLMTTVGASIAFGRTLAKTLWLLTKRSIIDRCIFSSRPAVNESEPLNKPRLIDRFRVFPRIFNERPTRTTSTVNARRNLNALKFTYWTKVFVFKWFRRILIELDWDPLCF